MRDLTALGLLASDEKPVADPVRCIRTNKPHGEARLFRAKGGVQLIEGGAVSIKTRTERNGAMFFDLSPVLVLDCVSALCPDALLQDHLVQFLEDYGVDTPKTLAAQLVQSFYVIPHIQVMPQDATTPAQPE